MGYDRLYYLKKRYALYPGVRRPRSAGLLVPHYNARRAERGPLRAILDGAVGLLFHAWLPWRARIVQKRFGLDAAWRRRAVAIAHAAFADPNDIALFRIESKEQIGSYIRRFEDAALNKRINPGGWRKECALADKRRFAERCAVRGLPYPETVALVDRGATTVLADPAGRALVAKPADGEGGSGVTMLGIVKDEAALRTALSSATERGLIVVQPLIETHPALADLALGALPTVRIVTILDEKGAPEVVSATFRCPSDPTVRVDNMKAGGLIVPVDMETGALGIACKGYGGGDYPRHPVTGAEIEGRVLPDWPAAKALAVKAHAEAFGDYCLVGWDVALTPTMPVLIEGNGKPGVLMPQRAARSGLAQGRYGALLAHHLQQDRSPPVTRAR